MNGLADFGADYKERVEKAIALLQQGKGILLVDDDDRENEGDIIYAAQNMSVADMALMIRECSGIVCLCITPERAKALELRPMVTDNSSKNQTAFTITIEAKKGVTTGVSAADRITTIRTAIAVFERRGHTEGSIDLAKLAGLGDTAVLCELTNEDGTMARLPEIAAFSEKHGMTVVSIEDICQYRKDIEGK